MNTIHKNVGCMNVCVCDVKRRPNGESSEGEGREGREKEEGKKLHFSGNWLHQALWELLVSRDLHNDLGKFGVSIPHL